MYLILQSTDTLASSHSVKQTEALVLFLEGLI